MNTPEPLSTARLYELCELAKTSHCLLIEVKRDELWALVDMAKERNEILAERPAVMTTEEANAYRWAINSPHSSVASRYARTLAGYIYRSEILAEMSDGKIVGSIDGLELITVGGYRITHNRDGDYWIGHDSGECMQVFKLNFEKLIDDYYKSEF